MITLTRVKGAFSAFIKVLRYGKYDVQTALPVGPFGLDSKPNKETVAVHATTGNDSEPVILGYVSTVSSIDVGETRLYSEDSSGNTAFEIILKSDGQCEFGGTGDYAVRFNKLESGYNELRDDHNDLVSKYNSHTHPYLNVTTPAVTSVTTSIDTPSTASISAAKIDEIEVSG